MPNSWRKTTCQSNNSNVLINVLITNFEQSDDDAIANINEARTNFKFKIVRLKVFDYPSDDET